MMRRERALKILKDKGFTMAKYRHGTRTKTVKMEQWFDRFKQQAFFEFATFGLDIKGANGIAIVKPIGTILTTIAIILPDGITNVDEIMDDLIFPKPKPKISSTRWSFIKWWRSLFNK